MHKRSKQYILCLLERELAEEIVKMGYDVDSFVEQALREKITAIRRLYKSFNLENSQG